MSDLLSQDEIDALLHGVDEVEEEEIDINEQAVKLPSITTSHLKIALYVVACQRLKLLTSVLPVICVLAYSI